MVRSKNTVLRIVGFHMVVFAISVLLGLIIMAYTNEVVVKAMGVCASISVMMTALSVIKPEFFLKLGRTLFVALLTGIVMTVLFGMVFNMDTTWIDWLMIVVFSGFIGYDWAIAQRYPMTIGNAVFAAASLYIDIVNIFIRLLSIFGRRD